MNTIPNVGDVVQLNSGGPAMVVSAHGSHGSIFVVWINQDGVPQTTSFPIECVKSWTAREPIRPRQPS